LDSSLIGDDFVDESAAIRKSKGYADHFECNGHNPLGLGIEAVEELSDDSHRAQQPERIRRLGVLMTVAPDDLEGRTRLTVTEAFQQLGWGGRPQRAD
jgi:hypothetical protein